ncbi:11685_t:CDS:2 [Funneliformis geosporum]|uniref:11685_t:CDS:1 n=1 Tax=Funneliformis geosporum TaxID=1117311 RepID=A0A9W4SCF0_9GLOM|nr:11685_t:CDS:2 [Funneliformis geosporum]
MSEVPSTMFALQLNEIGPVSNLKYVEMKVPTINSPYQVIVKVIATGVNPVDYKVRKGLYPLSNIFGVPKILGNDFSGIVVAKGSKVSEFNIGDEVFGKVQNPFIGVGTYAQYTRVDTKGDGIVKKPATITHQEAAGFGIAGITAWTGLINVGGLKVDEEAKEVQKKILVIGASGGVGTFTVQIAKNINHAQVTAICSGKNAELIKKLGADRIIDYTKEDFVEVLKEEKESFDLVIDCVGGDEFYTKSIPILKKKGLFITYVGPDTFGERASTSDVLWLLAMMVNRNLFGERSYRFVLATSLKDLPKMATYLEKRQIVTVIDREFDLKDGHQAHEMIESHRTVGKIILNSDCYQPTDLLKSGSQLKRVECKEWIVEDPKGGKSPTFNQEGSPPESMFQVTFTCGLINQDELCQKVQSSFENAAKIISSTIKLNTQIKVNAKFYNFCKEPPNCLEEDRVIGAAGATNYYSLKDEVDGFERLYPQALVKQFNFQGHPIYEEFDIQAMFNSKFSYHFDGDVKPMNATDYDITYIITHELIHGLGFTSSWKPLSVAQSAPPLGLLPAIATKDGIIVKEFIFDKFMIRLDDGNFTSDYTKEIQKYFIENKDVNDEVSLEELIKAPQFKIMQEMLRLSTTPKTLGFLPHDSTDYIRDSAILETSFPIFKVGSTLSHLDFSTYLNTSDFLMMPKAIPGKTHDELIQLNGNYGLIGPKITSILESIGYATTEYPNPSIPQPFQKPATPDTNDDVTPKTPATIKLDAEKELRRWKSTFLNQDEF